jgi:hypothetical protein
VDCTCRSFYYRPISKTPGLINPEESPELNADLSKLARNQKDARLAQLPAGMALKKYTMFWQMLRNPAFLC